MSESHFCLHIGEAPRISFDSLYTHNYRLLHHMLVQRIPNPKEQLDGGTWLNFLGSGATIMELPTRGIKICPLPYGFSMWD